MPRSSLDSLSTLVRQAAILVRPGLISCLVLPLAAVAAGQVATAESPPVEARDPEQAGEPADTTPIATWRGGEVSRQLYERWLAHSRFEDDPAQREALARRLLVTLELAEAARARGAREELAVVLDRFESKLLLAAYRKSLGEKIVVGEQEVEAALRKYPDAFNQPRRVRLRNLFKRLPESATEKQKESLRRQMATWLQQLRAGDVDFEELARRESDSENRLRGGRLPVVSAGQLRSPMDEVAMALKPGELSDVLETADGFTLLYCEEVLPAITVGEQERAERIERNIRSMRVKAQWEKASEALLEEAEPVYDLAAALDPASGPEKEILRFRGGHLQVRDLEKILARSPVARKRTEVQERGLRRLLEDHVIQVMAARKAEEAGLVTAEHRERVYWRTVEILAADEVGERVQERLEEPTEAKLREAFGRLPEPPQRLPHFRLALLRLPIGDDVQASWQTSRRLVERLRAGELSFEEAARRFSEDISASEGGGIGWFSRRDMAGFGPVAHRAILEMKPGQLSDPIREAGAWWVFKLLEKEEARPLTFEEARDELAGRLIRERLEALQADLIERLGEGLELELTPQVE